MCFIFCALRKAQKTQAPSFARKMWRQATKIRTTISTPNHPLLIMATNSNGNSPDGLPPLPPLPISVADLRKSHGFSDQAQWAIPHKLMQGARPGFGLSDNSSLAEQVQKIVGEGKITTFVSLQAECLPEEGSILLDGGGSRKSEPKNLPPYWKEIESAATKFGMPPPTFLYYGIIGMKTAKSIDSLSIAAKDLAKRITSGETIYVHCGGGVGRAGLVSACVMGVLYKNLSADAAIEYTTGLCHLRNLESNEEKHYSSPETEEQKEQVRQFFKTLGK